MSVVQRTKACNEVSPIDCCPADEDDVFKHDAVSNLLILAAGKLVFSSSSSSCSSLPYIIACHRSRALEDDDWSK